MSRARRCCAALRRAPRLIKFGEIDGGTRAGENIGNNCLAPLAQLEGDDER